ncbi:MAG TPA: proline hydroxylase, partial [Actinoallomurus sp.]|nr:proline hydroxylase [Actinoallomurus sp.]
MTTTTMDAFARRVASADWETVTGELNEYGCALMPRLLTPEQCRDLAGLYDQADRFRSTVDMGRHRFGSGEYRYFDRPFPEPVQRLREELYPRL